MIKEKDSTHVSILIVGAGPAGLAAAIAAKSAKRDADIVILEKGDALGNHNVSGAVLEIGPLKRLLDEAMPDWRNLEGADHISGRVVQEDEVYFLPGKKLSLNISPLIGFGKKSGLPFGELDKKGNSIVSISKLTRFLGKVASSLGVEIYTSFGVKEILYDQTRKKAYGVRLVDQGLNKEGHPQPNYLKGETITADSIILAEGVDGLVTEDFVAKAGLKRRIHQVFSVGVKEIIRVSKERYELFGDNRVIHTMGYPLWFPVVGPDIFGGGFAYSYGDNQIAIGIIAGADWKYYNFNPQKALRDLKNHPLFHRFIDGGEVIEAGAKIIPEGGYYAIPRHVETNSDGKTTSTIGYKNVIIAGDSAGFVNMLKIKGLHNAIESGSIAGKALIRNLDNPDKIAAIYTSLLEHSSVMKEMESAKNFRAVIAKLGPTMGIPLSVISKYLPEIHMKRDFETMTTAEFTYDAPGKFDKATFVALAGTRHREDQPSHLTILDQNPCIHKCDPLFDRACITFCPAGVYEQVGMNTLPANPSNCLHCKTCQRKCPFDNIRWTVPEGGGGPRYKQM